MGDRFCLLSLGMAAAVWAFEWALATGAAGSQETVELFFLVSRR